MWNILVIYYYRDIYYSIFKTWSHDLCTVTEKLPLFPSNTFAVWFLLHCERKYAMCVS